MAVLCLLHCFISRARTMVWNMTTSWSPCQLLLRLFFSVCGCQSVAQLSLAHIHIINLSSDCWSMIIACHPEPVLLLITGCNDQKMQMMAPPSLITGDSYKAWHNSHWSAVTVCKKKWCHLHRLAVKMCGKDAPSVPTEWSPFTRTCIHHVNVCGTRVLGRRWKATGNRLKRRC